MCAGDGVRFRPTPEYGAGFQATLFRPHRLASCPGNAISMKTRYSFEFQYNAGLANSTGSAGSASSVNSYKAQAQRDVVMRTLGPVLQQRLAANDANVRVLVSDSHKGANHKLVELVTTLEDAQIAPILKAFAEQYGVEVNAFE
jgi:hypothetical protein